MIGDCSLMARVQDADVVRKMYHISSAYKGNLSEGFCAGIKNTIHYVVVSIRQDSISCKSRQLSAEEVKLGAVLAVVSR